MNRHGFYRNVRADDHLEIFLVSAVTSLLLLRFYLAEAGYPQVGGSHFHIAHMLYGGLLMMAALVLTLTYLGARILRVSAVVGGIGFGVFIDELGKFITKDNNYFFRPTIGILYALFIGLYLIFRFISRVGRLTPHEYELNALMQFEEAILQNLDPLEKRRIGELLAQGDSHSPLVKQLQVLLQHLNTVAAPRPSVLRKLRQMVGARYQQFWQRRGSNKLVGAIFLIEALAFFLGVFGTVAHGFESLLPFIHHEATRYEHWLLVGQVVSSVVSGVCAVAGALSLAASRTAALEWFRRAVLINLFLTEFFIFARIQFAALPGFVLNLALLIGLRYALFEERRLAELKTLP